MDFSILIDWLDSEAIRCSNPHGIPNVWGTQFDLPELSRVGRT